MRTRIAVALVGVGIAVSFLPVSPASASCWYITEELDCVSPPCAAPILNKVDDKTGDHLGTFACPT
jgi:hypothetical protein